MEQLLGDSVLVRLCEVDLKPRAVRSFAEGNIHQTGLILILTTHPSLELEHRTANGSRLHVSLFLHQLVSDPAPQTPDLQDRAAQHFSQMDRSDWDKGGLALDNWTEM